MNNNSQDNQKYVRIFFPTTSEAIAEVKKQGGRFAYYTTAATAFQILKNREVWMRNTLTMNDFTEVEHGLNCLIAASATSTWDTLTRALDACFDGISVDIKNQFNAWIPGIKKDTFITCLSEHAVDDDLYGRLSMWRAYGGSSGVALILNGNAMMQESTELPAYTVPVQYLDESGIINLINLIAEEVTRNRDFLQSRRREDLINSVFRMLWFTAISTKHSAFKEEKEWRIVSSPSLQSSDLLSQSIELIGSVPQTILKIKLEDRPEKGLNGLNPEALIDRVLIGPCEYPDVIRRSLHNLMSNAGIPDPGSKIIVTGIPLRANQR